MTIVSYIASGLARNEVIYAAKKFANEAAGICWQVWAPVVNRAETTKKEIYYDKSLSVEKLLTKI